jgi:hypothetical protein
MHRRFVLGALIASAAIAAASCTSAPSGARTVTVTHGPVTLVYADLGQPGPSVGDTRGTEIATKVEGSQVTGRLDAILTTTAVDSPGKGDEIRIGHLVFTFASPDDQIVIDGASVYAGARGYAESSHLADGTWRHVFHLMP